MREYIRHPSDIPIDFHKVEDESLERECLLNISEGGLCFHSERKLREGSVILIEIPVRAPVFKIAGVVVWCKQHDQTDFEVGVQFQNITVESSVRIIEEICHIEHYKKEILENEGRDLTSEQAAAEWIEKHADTFPE